MCTCETRLLHSKLPIFLSKTSALRVKIGPSYSTPKVLPALMQGFNLLFFKETGTVLSTGFLALMLYWWMLLKILLCIIMPLHSHCPMTNYKFILEYFLGNWMHVTHTRNAKHNSGPSWWSVIKALKYMFTILDEERL